MCCGCSGIYCGQHYVYVVDNNAEYVVGNLLWVKNVYIVDNNAEYIVGNLLWVKIIYIVGNMSCIYCG